MERCAQSALAINSELINPPGESRGGFSRFQSRLESRACVQWRTILPHALDPSDKGQFYERKPKACGPYRARILPVGQHLPLQLLQGGERGADKAGEVLLQHTHPDEGSRTLAFFPSGFPWRVVPLAKRANPRRLKRHRNYTIEEAARALGVTKASVRNWIGRGLPALKDQQPFLILGCDLIGFLEVSTHSKQSCKPHQCYCFKCRRPRDPAFREVEYFPSNSDGGSIRALCEECSTVMQKRVSQRALTDIERHATVQIRQG